MAPVVEGSSPFTHPKAPVAQLDRASDFESAGRPFEPDRARHEPRRVRGCPEPYMVQGAVSFKQCKVQGCHVPCVVHGARTLLTRIGEPLAQLVEQLTLNQ